MNNRVSIITPSYNSEKYILETIKSVQKQTYTNWEMIIVDDCSVDNTCSIVESISKADSRINLIRQEKNLGAGLARNRAMSVSKGRFIAYLDSDDIWYPEKLEKQMQFMVDHGYGFSCSSYEVINDSGKLLHKEIHMLPKVNYIGFLTNNLLQTVGIMIDTSIVNKDLLIMPDIRRRQDAATWLQILKANYICYGFDEILAQYRRTENSLSSKKIKAIKGMWYLYRDIEHLPLLFSYYCFIRYVFLAVWKRVYIRGRKNESAGFNDGLS